MTTQSTTETTPRTGDPALDGDHERMAHIVKKGDATEAYIAGTPIEALCGKIWVPSRDPKRYPLCPTCKEIAQQFGWRVPEG